MLTKMIRGEMNFQQRRKYMLGRWPIIFSISVQNCSIPENKREKLHCKKRKKKFKQMFRDISVELIYHVGHIVPLDRISTFYFAVVVENQLLRYMNALTDLHCFCFFFILECLTELVGNIHKQWTWVLEKVTIYLIFFALLLTVRVKYLRVLWNEWYYERIRNSTRGIVCVPKQ